MVLRHPQLDPALPDVVTDRLQHLRYPDYLACSILLRQHQRQRLVGLSESVRHGGASLLHAVLLHRFDASAGHQHFDQPPLYLPGNRFVEPCIERVLVFPEISNCSSRSTSDTVHGWTTFILAYTLLQPGSRCAS